MDTAAMAMVGTAVSAEGTAATVDMATTASAPLKVFIWSHKCVTAATSLPTQPNQATATADTAAMADTAATQWFGATAATVVGTVVGMAVGTPAMAVADIGAKTTNKTLDCYEVESYNKQKINKQVCKLTKGVALNSYS